MSQVPPSPMLDLKGRVYVVTGASRGIGLSVAHAFARRGAKVGMLARGEAELRARAEEIGADALAVAVDTSSKEAFTRAVDQVAAHFGALHGIVNNAGVSRLAPVLETSEADARFMIDVDILGTLFGMQAALPHLRKVTGGMIVNVSSSTVRHRDEFTHMGVYAAVKAAVERITAEARDELKHEGIAVGVFSPGSTIGYQHLSWADGAFDRALVEWRKRGETCDGAAPPEVIGEAIVRMFELPAGVAYDLVELRPIVQSPRRQMQGDMEDRAAPTVQA